MRIEAQQLISKSGTLSINDNVNGNQTTVNTNNGPYYVRLVDPDSISMTTVKWRIEIANFADLNNNQELNWEKSKSNRHSIHCRGDPC